MNMTYCMAKNTADDLRDVYCRLRDDGGNWLADIDDRELRALREIVELSRKIIGLAEFHGVQS